ncbi:hypothetical protein Tco_0913941 [Tanacetum coccineum]
MVVNNLYQPWRAILSMINQCLTGKTSGHDSPRYPVPTMSHSRKLQNEDSPDIQFFRCFRELLQALMLTMLNLCGKNLYRISRHFLLTRPIWAVPLRRAGKTSLMLFPIADSRSLSSVIWEEFTIFIKDQHLRFILLNKTSDLHDHKVTAKKEGKKKSASTKQPKPKPDIKKSSKPVPAPKPKVTKEKPFKASTTKPPKPKPAKERSTKATPLQKAGKGKVAKVRNVKSAFQLVDEPDEEPAHSEPEPQPEHQEAIQPQKARDDTSANIAHDSPSPATRSDKTSSGCDTEVLQITEELGKDVEKQENIEEKTVELDEDQVGSDPGETHESQPLPDQAHMDED